MINTKSIKTNYGIKHEYVVSNSTKTAIKVQIYAIIPSILSIIEEPACQKDSINLYTAIFLSRYTMELFSVLTPIFSCDS